MNILVIMRLVPIKYSLAQAASQCLGLHLRGLPYFDQWISDNGIRECAPRAEPARSLELQL